MTVDMRKVSFETNEGSFEGRVEVVVNDTNTSANSSNDCGKFPGFLRWTAWRIDRVTNCGGQPLLISGDDNCVGLIFAA